MYLDYLDLKKYIYAVAFRINWQFNIYPLIYSNEVTIFFLLYAMSHAFEN